VSFYYSVSGLSILSNCVVPNLRPAEIAHPHPDIEFRLGLRPTKNDQVDSSDARLRYASAITNPKGEPALKIWESDSGARLHMVYYDGTEFWFDRAGTTLYATWPESSSIENTALYLLGPVLALVLRYRGVVCLHASAVVIDGRAIAFVGPEEAGKSTTAAAFARKGFAILSDDVVPLQEQNGVFLALPGSPQLRLWPESVEMLFGCRDALPPLLPDWEKRRFSEGDHHSTFSEKPCELAAIYLLNDRSSNSGAPRIEGVSQQQALITLIANSYASQVIDARMLADELAFFGRVVSSVRVRQLTPHTESQHIDQLCDLVCADISTPSLITDPSVD